MPIGEKDSAPEAKAVLWRRLIQVCFCCSFFFFELNVFFD